MINNKIILVSLLPLLFFPAQFLSKTNYSHTTLWTKERIPSRFYQNILSKSEEEKINYTIGGYHMRNLSWAYLDYTNGSHLNQIQHSHYPENYSDYQIVVIEDYPVWLNNYNMIDFDSISKLSLLRRKEFLSSTFIDSVTIKSNGEINFEYFNFYSGKTDTLLNKTLKVSFDITINSPATPFKAWIVGQVNDENNNIVKYEFMALDWKKSSWHGEKHNLTGSFLLYNLPKSSKNFGLYLWNIEKSNYTIENAHFNINQLATD